MGITCMWTGLENLSFLCLRPLSHLAPQHHTSFCSWLSAQTLRWFFPLSPQESCFWNVASQMASQGYPCANQRTPFLLLCLCCPLLFARSKPLLLRAPQAQFSQTLHFFQPLGVPWCTYKPPFYPVSLRISASKQGLHHGTRRAGAPTLAGEEIEART